MLVGVSRYLGQMGDGQHLALTTQTMQQAAYRVCHCTTHTRIHLVKDECARTAQCTGGHRNRQRESRQLSTRGDFAQWARGGARVACDPKLHVVHALCARLGQRVDMDGKTPTLHAQGLHGLSNGMR